MPTENFEYSDSSNTFEGYISYQDKTAKRPIVIIFHDWSGCSEFSKDKAEFFASKGYVGLAVDLYGKGVRGSKTDPTVNQKLMTPFIENRELITNHYDALVNVIKELDYVDSNKIAVIGFCFGGLCALDIARTKSNLLAAISVHGLLFAPNIKTREKINANVLVLHGNDDPMVPVEQVIEFQKEMSEKQADWQLHTFGNTLHAFTNPDANSPKFDPEGNPPSFGVQYNQAADARTWVLCHELLKEVF